MPDATITIAPKIRLDPMTADDVRLEADRLGLSLGDWIATVLRREIRRAGNADALPAQTCEAAVTCAYLLHALMLDAMGPEATARAFERAQAAGKQAVRDARAFDAELAP
jgi:hypothetical protein